MPESGRTVGTSAHSPQRCRVSSKPPSQLFALFHHAAKARAHKYKTYSAPTATC